VIFCFVFDWKSPSVGQLGSNLAERSGPAKFDPNWHSGSPMHGEKLKTVILIYQQFNTGKYKNRKFPTVYSALLALWQHTITSKIMTLAAAELKHSIFQVNILVG